MMLAAHTPSAQATQSVDSVEHDSANVAVASPISRSDTRRKQNRSCPVCKRTFTKSEHLTRHLRSHTKERPFRCQRCGKHYARNDTLLRHERSHNVTATASTVSRGSISSVSSSAVTSPQDVPLVVPLDVRLDVSQTVYPTTTVPGQPSSHEQINPAVNPTYAHSYTGDPVEMLQSLQPLDVPENSAFMNEHDFNMDTWQSPENLNAAPWLLSNDFDVFALDAALTSTVSEWVHIPAQLPTRESPRPTTTSPNIGSIPFPDIEAVRASTTNHVVFSQSQKDASAKALDAIGRQWFTQLQNDQGTRARSRAVSETPGEQLNVDEMYRDQLSSKLKNKVVEETLPPVDFLNLCLRSYITRFHPIFPVIHIQSFRPTSQNAYLILSMCSIGSLFVGSVSARAKGLDIFSRLNKVILASWDIHLSQGKQEALSMVQTALLGQTFAMLSGRSNDLIQADMYHGTMLAWARKLGIFKQSRFEMPAGNLESASLQHTWQEWIRFEQTSRLSLALTIHDSELASIFHHQPLLRQNSIQRSGPFAHDGLFQAPSAKVWLRLISDQAYDPSTTSTSLDEWVLADPALNNSISQGIGDSKFMAYSTLEALNAAVIEARQCCNMGVAKVDLLGNGLLSWFRTCQAKRVFEGVDTFQLRVLWHSVYISLYADIDKLEIAIGRDGHKEAGAQSSEVCTWLTTQDATRCLVHGILLQEQVEAIKLGSEPAMHVPRALYLAAMVWLVCSRFGNPNQSPALNISATTFPELQFMDTASVARVADSSGFPGASLASKSVSVTYGLVDLLQRLRRWGIAENLAKTLTAALDSCVD